MSFLDDDDAYYEEAFKIADTLSQNNVKNTNNYPTNSQQQNNASFNQNRPTNNYSASPKRQFTTPNVSNVKTTQAPTRSLGPFFPPSATNNAARPTPVPNNVNQIVQQTIPANRPTPSFPKANPKFAYTSMHNNSAPNPNTQNNNPPPVVRPAFASGDNIMSPKVFKVGSKKNTQAGPGSARSKGNPAIQIQQNNTPTKQRAVPSDFPEDDVFDVDQDLLQANNKPVRQQLTFRSAYGGDNNDRATKKASNNNNNPINNSKSNSHNTENVFDAGALKKAMTKAPTKKDPFGTKLSTDFPHVVDNCDDPPIVDEEAIKSWIYPSNKQMRDYQYDIVQKGLYENTLVCLPTGLGKTFIAAVIMLNFYRWFPLGKLIFMAPTKPLVNQQIEACHSIAGLPQSDMIQMVGTMAPAKRREYWAKKRIFFVTPQIFDNDLSSDICPGKSVVLLIADEAHKAQGNYAYCNAVAKMASLTPYFRVLALSATPGKNVETIQSVICNLLISGMSVRTDEDVDVKSYIHSKQLDVVKVQLGHAITQVREAFLKVASIPINELVNQNCFYTRNVSKLTRGAVFSACQRFRQSPPKNIEEHHKPQIEALFGVSTTLFHAWDLLNNHSISQFRTTITDLKNKEALKKVSRFHMELVRTEEFQHLLEVLEEVIESGSIDHPKLKAVERIINEHFEQNESEETRVMLFVEYRESVELITNLLKNYEPRVKPSQFVGQASGKTKGMSQREQQEVLQKFKAGEFNTLVASCVGEEGLDIGEVDLIICYDATISPVRIIQRMGRTGRKRDGRCVMLVTEGQEEGALLRTNKKKNTLFKSLVKNADRTYTFYANSPRLVPDDIDPEVEFRLVHVDEWQGGQMTPVKAKTTKATTSDKSKSKKKLAFDENMNNNNGDPLEEEHGDDWYLNDREQQVYLSEYVPPNNIRPVLKINRFMEDQAIPSPTFHVGHSSMSRTLTRAIQFSQFGESGDAYVAEVEEYLQWEDVEMDFKGTKSTTKAPTKTTTTAIKRPIQEVVDVDDDFKTPVQPPKKKQKIEHEKAPDPIVAKKPADTFKVPTSVPKATIQSPLKFAAKPVETKVPEKPVEKPVVESKGVSNVKSRLSKFAFKGEDDYEPAPEVEPVVTRPQPAVLPRPTVQQAVVSPAKPKQPTVEPPKQSVVTAPIVQSIPVPVVHIPSVQLEKPKDNMEVALDQELDDFFNSSQDFDLGDIVDVPISTKPSTNQTVQSVNTPRPTNPTPSSTNPPTHTSFELDVNASASLDIFDDDASYSLRIPSPPQSQKLSMPVDSEPPATLSHRQQTPKTAPLAQSSAQAPTQKIDVPTIVSPAKPRAPVQSSPIKLPSNQKLNTLPLVQNKSSPLDTSCSPKSNSSASLSLPSTPQPKARRRLQMAGQTSTAPSLLTANKKRIVADDSDLESISDVDEDAVMKDVEDNKEEDDLDDDIEMSDSSDSSPLKPKKRSLKNSSAFIEAEAEESGEDADSDSEERSNSDDDRNLSDFITSDDDTSPPSQSGNVNMTAIYLRSLSSQSSVRPASFDSPKRNGTKYKLNEKVLKQREKQRIQKKKKREIVDDIQDDIEEEPENKPKWIETVHATLEIQTRMLMDEPVKLAPLPVTPIKITPKVTVPVASPDMFEFEDICSDSPKNKITSIPSVPSTLKSDAFVAVNNDSIAGPLSDSSGFMDEDLDMGFDDFSLGLTFGDMSAPQSNVATNNTNVPFLTPTVPSSNTHSAVDLDDIAGSTAIDSTTKPRVKEPLPKRVAAPVDRVTVVASPEDFITSLSTHFNSKKSTVLTSSLLSSEYILADNIEGSIALRRQTSGVDDAKFLQRLGDVSQKYKYCYLIVEADGKLSPTHERVVHTVLEITQTKDIRVVFSNDVAHSAIILHGLATYESGCAQPMSDLSNDWLIKHEKSLNFLLSVPSINFSTAVRLIMQFKSMKEVIAASVDQLQARVIGLSQDAAKTLFNYFRLSISGSVHN